jgi:hypothetical protein
MTDPLTIIEAAFNQLKQSVNVTDAHAFETTTLEDVFKAAEEVERAELRRRAPCNMKRIKPLLDFLEKYSMPMEILAWFWVSYRITSLEIY